MESTLAPLKITPLPVTLETALSVSSFAHIRRGTCLSYFSTIWNVITNQYHVVIESDLSVASRGNSILNQAE